MTHTGQRTAQITRAAVFTALIAIMAQLSIPVGTIPMTMQVLGVALAGYMLGSFGGAAAVLAYLALGAVGAPVFGGFRGGLSALTGPTGGFLSAFPAVAAVCGLRVSHKLPLPLIALPGILALLPMYALGTLWLSNVSGMGVHAALAAAVYPFVIKDVLSVLAAAYLARAVRRRGLFLQKA